jgi:hypothetical protein
VVGIFRSVWISCSFVNRSSTFWIQIRIHLQDKGSLGLNDEKSWYLNTEGEAKPRGRLGFK